MSPIDSDCNCSTCKTYTRAYLHHIVTHEAVSCTLLSIHNIAFQLRLMSDIRESIKADKFPQFVQNFMKEHFNENEIPSWIKDALKAVKIEV